MDSPILFNCVLDKVMKTFHKVNSTRVRIGNKSKGVELSCLAFTDDLAIFTHLEEEARKQVEDLKRDSRENWSPNLS